MTNYECIVLDKANQRYLLGWRGIIETIIFNMVIGSVFIFIYTAIRVYYLKRRPYYNDWNIGWVQFIYGDRSAEMLSGPCTIDRQKKDSYLPPELWPHANDPNKSAHIVLTNLAKERAKEEHQQQLDSLGRRRFWLWDYLCIPLGDIRRHRGADAAQYLLCQQYLIYYLTMLSGICLLVLLPANVYGGTVEGDNFEKTTINALDSSSKMLWIHAVVTVLLVILGVVVMRLYWNHLPIHQPVCDERTLMFSNVEEIMRSARTLYRYFKRCFHSVKVTRITNTYDIAELANTQAHLQMLKEAVRYSKCYEEENGTPLQVNPNIFCCRSWVNALEYYTKESEKYEKVVKHQTDEVLSTLEHVVFVQFQNASMAQRVLKHFEATMNRRTLHHDLMTLGNICCCGCCSRGSSEGDKYVYNDWDARFAPVPEDIVWSDIIMSPNKACFTAYILTILLILCVFCLTTPLIATNYLHLILIQIGIEKEEKDKPPKSKMDWVQWLLVDNISLIIASLLDKYVPELSIYIQRLVPRMTKSSKDHRLLQTSYMVLFFTGFIAPSTGLLSIQILVTNWYIDKSTEMIQLYKCLFPSQNSVFFLKLIFVYTFFDLTYDLLRLGDLSYYIFNCLIYPKNEAEFHRAREKTLPFSFSYVSNFTSDLLIFSIVVIYAVACPLIAPVGLFFMLVKHYLDRYKIYYLNALPNRISLAVHQTVLYIVLMSFFFLLLQMTAFLTTNRPWSWTLDPAMVVLIAFVLYSVFLLLFSWCLFSLFFNCEQQSQSSGHPQPPQRTTVSHRSSKKGAASSRPSSRSKKSENTKSKLKKSTKRDSKKKSTSHK